LEFEREEREKKKCPPKINHLTSVDTHHTKRRRTR